MLERVEGWFRCNSCGHNAMPLERPPPPKRTPVEYCATVKGRGLWFPEDLIPAQLLPVTVDRNRHGCS